MVDVTKPVQGRDLSYTGLRYVGTLTKDLLVWGCISKGEWETFTTDRDGRRRYPHQLESLDVINVPAKPVTIYVNVYGGPTGYYTQEYPTQSIAQEQAFPNCVSVAVPVTFTPKER